MTAAVNDSSFSQGAPRRLRLLWWLVPIILLALAFALYQTRSQWISLLPADLLSPTKAKAVAAVEISPTDAGSAESAEAAAVVDAPAVAAGVDDLPAPAAEAETSIAAVDATPVDSAAQAPPVAVDSESPVAAAEAPATEVAGETGSAQPAAPQAAADQPEATAGTDIESLSAEVDTLVSQIEIAVQQAKGSAPEADTTAQAPERNKSSPTAGTDGVADYLQWLDAKLEQSQRWLRRVGDDKMSIQVLMRNKSGEQELVYHLRNKWPLDVSQTYLYEVEIDGRSIFRVFYGEFDSLKKARAQIDAFPQSIKVNSPYVHSVNRMRQALL